MGILSSDSEYDDTTKMLLFCSSLGTACGAIMFAAATDTIIPYSLSRQYEPVLSLFLCKHLFKAHVH